MALTGPTARACADRGVARELSQRYRLTGATRGSASVIPGVGSDARALETVTAVWHDGRRFTWHLRWTWVREGRVIEMLGTETGASVASYDTRLARRLADLTSRIETYLAHRARSWRRATVVTGPSAM